MTFSFNMWKLNLNKKAGNMWSNPKVNSDWNFSKNALNLYLWTHRRKFHDLAESFLTKFRTFFIQTSKKFVRLYFLPKNHFKLFLWTKKMQFRQSGGKYIKRLKVFPQILKTVLMKKILSWEKASWKTAQNAVFTTTSNIFWESLNSSRSNSDTSIANTQPCRHFFC